MVLNRESPQFVWHEQGRTMCEFSAGCAGTIVPGTYEEATSLRLDGGKGKRIWTIRNSWKLWQKTGKASEWI